MRGAAYDSGATVLIRGEEAVLVDALGSRADAEALRRFVDADLGKRVRFVLCTHYFSDHVAALGLFPEAEIVAQRFFRHTWDLELHRSAEERSFFVAPTVLVDSGLTLRWGRFTLDAFHVPGHTMSTLAIDVPEADLLFVGDTVVGRIGYFLYTSPQLLAEGLETLERRGRARLLASHGGVEDGGAIAAARQYLASFESKTRRARAERDGAAAVRGITLAECLAPGLTPTDFEEVFHRRNLDTALDRGADGA